MHAIRPYHILAVIAFLAALLFAPLNLKAQENMGTQQDGEEKPPPAFEADPCTIIEPSPETLFTSSVVDEEPVKSIIISLADQAMWIFENESIIRRFPVSTGRPGHPTPPGSYSVHNRSLRAYSQRYECYMLNWMAITGDGMIGMHALEGHAYERHLGSVASHGCIRLSHEDALWLYDWVEIGIPVEIVTDWDEPVPQQEETLEEYPFHW